MLRLFFIFIVTSCFAQKNSILNCLKSTVTSIEKQELIDSIISLKKTGLTDEQLNFGLLHYSKWLYGKRIFKKSVIIGEKSLFFSEKNFPSDSISIEYKLYLLGYYSLKCNDFKKSISYFKKCKDYRNNGAYVSESYAGLARNYFALEDYYKAIDYNKMALIVLTRKKNNKQSLVTTYTNIARAYQGIGTIESIDQGRIYLLKADSIVQTLSKINYKSKVKLLLNLAQTYNHTKSLNIKKANTYFNRSLKIAITKKDSSLTALTLRLKGNLYNTTKVDSSIYFQKKSLKYTSLKDTLAIISSYSNLAYCYGKKEDYVNCKKYATKNIKLLTKKKIDELLLSKNRNHVYRCAYKNNLLITLLEYCEAMMSQAINTKNVVLANNTLKIYDLADELVDLIQINTKELKSRLHWRKEASEFYVKAIKASFLADDLESAFHFMEKNKAMVLMEDLRLKKIKEHKSLPKKLLISIQKLETDVFIKEKELKLLNNRTIQSEYLQKREDLVKLNDSIKKINPNIVQLNSKTLLMSLTDVQNKMIANNCSIEYMIHENSGYGMLIESKDVFFFELEVELLRKNVEKLLTKMNTPFKTKQDTEDYHKLANEVFTQLFAKEEIRERIKNKKLIVIPDNFLSSLPFEALTSNVAKKRYLIEDTQVSYIFSNSFSKYNNSKKSKVNSVVAFAPEQFNIDSLPSLTHSTKEVNSIQNIIKSTLFSKKEATKANFLKNLTKNNILHLATHADAYDSIAPWIAFYDKKLTLDELYLTKNNAELVVLSGCKTNKGKLAVGEGVMSLSRGFFQTGAKSIISSLWSIDDKATTDLMHTFYKNLSLQKTKSEALHLAKLKYLNDNSLSNASPYYWASLVLIGDSGTISVPVKYNWKCLGVGLLMMLLIIFFLLKYKRS